MSRVGYDLVPYPQPSGSAVQIWPTDFEARDIDICQRVAPFTMTSPERIYAAIRDVTPREIRLSAERVEQAPARRQHDGRRSDTA